MYIEIFIRCVTYQGLRACIEPHRFGGKETSFSLEQIAINLVSV